MCLTHPTTPSTERLSEQQPVMRYDTWDVILFGGDSHIPTQEFRTTCYLTQDEHGQQLPTLTCYIASLPASNPFRISVHSWSTKAKPTAIIESRRKKNQRVVYMTQVIIDGTRVCHDFCELLTRWPQEIAHEKRSIVPFAQQSSQPTIPLEFPPFRQDILLQTSWDARDDSGRIKIMLSEQLIGNTGGPSELEFGATNHIVCFSFQHAPRNILEQAGISWPIRNPLYLPPQQYSYPNTAEGHASHKPRASNKDSHAHSSAPKPTKSPFSRLQNPEQNARPNTTSPAHSTPIPKPPSGNPDRVRATVFEACSNEVPSNPFDDANVMDDWSTYRPSSGNPAGITIPDVFIASPASSKLHNSWDYDGTFQSQEQGQIWGYAHGNKGREERLEPRENRQKRRVEGLTSLEGSTLQENNTNNNSNNTTYLPRNHLPKIGNMATPSSTRPSAAALARKASYHQQQSLRKPAHKASPADHAATKNQKETYRSPSSLGKENRNPSDPHNLQPFPFEPHIPTPHPQQLNSSWPPPLSRSETSWGPDTTEGRDPSSIYSTSFPRQFEELQPLLPTKSPAPAYSAIRSRKPNTYVAPSPNNKLDENEGVTDTITNDDDNNKGFKPGHRGGMSSMERVENKLFSALGEELGGGFHSSHDANGDGGDNSELVCDGDRGFNSPGQARKRQRRGSGSLVGEGVDGGMLGRDDGGGE